MKKNTDTAIYSSPFCLGYWKSALSEFKTLRTLVMAAMIVALRVAVKLIRIPIAENLEISLDFFVNSVGSMIYGPIVGLIVGAASDTIGAVLFPSGTYFFPFIFVEMLSSFIFGLFLYRAKLTPVRIILSRFAVVLFCNILVNPVIMKWYYIVVLGKDYSVFRWARIFKNIALLPAESILLVLWLSLISYVTYKMKLTYSVQEKRKLKPIEIVLVVVLTLISLAVAIGLIILYLEYKKNS